MSSDSGKWSGIERVDPAHISRLSAVPHLMKWDANWGSPSPCATSRERPRIFCTAAAWRPTVNCYWQSETDDNLNSVSEAKISIRDARRGVGFLSILVEDRMGFLGSAIKYHIEVNHLEGIALPCNHCANTFKTRMALRSHENKLHTQ